MIGYLTRCYTYHFGLGGIASLIAGHGRADLELLVEDGRVHLVTQQALLGLGLL